MRVIVARLLSLVVGLLLLDDLLSLTELLRSTSLRYLASVRACEAGLSLRVLCIGSSMAILLANLLCLLREELRQVHRL